MSHITITRNHNLPIEDLKILAIQIAEDLKAKYNGSYELIDKVLKFSGPGLDGNLIMEENDLRINVNLGFLIRPMKSLIENTLNEKVDEALNKKLGSKKAIK